jgi:hypothetical protein
MKRLLLGVPPKGAASAAAAPRGARCADEGPFVGWAAQASASSRFDEVLAPHTLGVYPQAPGGPRMGMKGYFYRGGIMIHTSSAILPGRSRTQQRFRPALRGTTALVVLLAAALLAGALPPAPAQAATSTALGWPESQKGIPDGSEVVLGEFFGESPTKVPCQAYVRATVVSNGLGTDSVSATEPTAWDECGSLTVTNGFTAVALNEQELRATAEPEMTLDEPGGCVYTLAQVAGHGAYLGRFALYEVAASATLKSGTSCAATLEVKGSVGLYGPQAGGFGVVPWVEVRGQEEALERELHEREEREAAEKQQREREARQQLETREILASLGKCFPAGKSATLSRLQKTGTWSFAFNAPVAGQLVVSWYETPKGAHLSANAEPVLVAAGNEAFNAGGTKSVTVRVTRRGKPLFRHARHLKLTANAIFTPTGMSAVVSLHTFALKSGR